MKALSGKVALVTGGTKGIGLGICRRFLEEGMRVYALDVDASAASYAADRLADVSEDRFHVLTADVREEADLSRVADEIGSAQSALHALINNAGLARARLDPIEDQSPDAWRRVIDTNLTGPYLCTKACLPLLRADGGAIVNIASTRAFQSEPNGEAYAASKGGLVALTHAMSISLGPAVRVNCICPGWIDVGAERPVPRPPMRRREHWEQVHPVGRIGTPGDVGGLAAFLVSEDAGFITGQSYICDGGMARKMVYA